LIITKTLPVAFEAKASASKELTPIAGTNNACDNPLMADNPTLKPVKLPGPVAAAKASISDKDTPEICNKDETRLKNVLECGIGALVLSEAMTTSPRAMAKLAQTDEVSTAKTSGGFS
jgi:hypothetical protein